LRFFRGRAERDAMSGKRNKRGELAVGTSGYQYDHWREVFYPKDVPKKRWFEHYAGHFETVEINNTFYSLPSVETFQRWRAQTPSGFVYALKYSRYGTHIKRLKDPERHVPTFLEHAEPLGPTLGPILVQLPPRWKPVPERLDAFLEAAPKDYRWTVEVRDERWLIEEVYEVLRRHGAALCIHDMIEGHPQARTANWMYLRFHGDHYTGSYTPEQLGAAAERVRGHLDEGVDVYAYFNNDQHGYAVRNALDLRQRVLGE
jgi:uncharacterized protein YecE (DUF72 family)